MSRRLPLVTCLCAGLAAPAAAQPIPLEAALSFAYPSVLTAAAGAPRVAYVRNEAGRRNVFVADTAGVRQVTRTTQDDGQELTGLVFSPDGGTLLYVRGGDHDANVPPPPDGQPNPALLPVQPVLTIHAVDVAGTRPPRALTEGDTPVFCGSATIVFVRNDQIWAMGRDGAKPHRLFDDRGKDAQPACTPDGRHVAFISNRGDHALLGLAPVSGGPIAFLVASTGTDAAPVISPDGAHVAWLRTPSTRVLPETFASRAPRPWSIMLADIGTGATRMLFHTGEAAFGSFPNYGTPVLKWAGNGRVLFTSDDDGWPHLYALDLAGGAKRLLTPGAFMVEDVAISPDGARVFYSANTGRDPNDAERRHVFMAATDGGGAPLALDGGENSCWTPVSAAGATAWIEAGVRLPPRVVLAGPAGEHPAPVAGQAPPAAFPASRFVTPVPVTFPASDGKTAHGVLFAPTGAGRHPAVVFLHGGPPRQMLLGFHYFDYYTNAYVMNQVLASRGFVVLALNYRLGIGYGHDYADPPEAGPAGASEYRDLLGAATWLRARADVDPARIGLWGGSYGGYLTALGLARNSDLFRAGVDLHGVHDWLLDAFATLPPVAGDAEEARRKALLTAWQASPDASVASWRSPVLLIHGDEDRNVPIAQTTDLAARLLERHVPFEEMLLPNEIHGFLRHATWRRVDGAILEFLDRTLGDKAASAK